MKTVGYITCLVILAFLGMFTVATLWQWFIVPLGVVSIGYAHAYGINLFVSFFLSSLHINTQNTGKSYGQKVAVAFAVNLCALGFGWIAHSFM